MPDRSGQPPEVLSPAERKIAESLLSTAWGEPVVVCAADAVWDRAHVVRLRTRDGRAAILKRERSDPEAVASGSESFGIELASLEFLAGMPVPVAPRLLGADVAAGVLVMEELPAGRSLADSLLLGDRVTALADLAAYATALGSMHAWSIGRTAGFEQARSRYSPAAPTGSWWRLFDFEFASVGSAALDAAYLLAPFPSCWCFADLPADTAATATATAATAFPRLRILAEALLDRLATRWPAAIIPAYPALAGADAALAERPEWWVPGR